LRLMRRLAGLSLSETAKACDLSYQQIQKYETGEDRMAASRLYHLARLFNVPVMAFFENLPAGLRDHDRGRNAGRRYRNDAAELIRLYYRIRDPKVRRTLCALIKSMGGDSEAGTS